jgi:hypothetical protein
VQIRIPHSHQRRGKTLHKREKRTKEEKKLKGRRRESTQTKSRELARKRKKKRQTYHDAVNHQEGGEEERSAHRRAPLRNRKTQIPSLILLYS